jgi:hypothetical protein
MTAAITTPFPTLEEVADRIGLSRKRARELAALASELTGKPVTIYAGARKSTKRSQRSSSKKVALKKK